jgi:predicted esterase
LRERAGAEVLYRETPMSHQIDPEFVREVADWLRAKLRSADRG